MFKSSGAIRQLEDKELLTEIWGVYLLATTIPLKKK